MDKVIDALGFAAIFIVIFAAFGVLFGGIVALPLVLINPIAYYIGSYVVAAVVAYRGTRAVMEMI